MRLTTPRRWRASARAPRRRVCLLKGCDRRFRPAHRAQQRYCGVPCTEAARRHARRLPRARRRRAEQARRYRQRRAGRRELRGWTRRAQSEGPARTLCARPGCLVTFRARRGNPARAYCGPGCRAAVHRQRDRAARWHERGRDRLEGFRLALFAPTVRPSEPSRGGMARRGPEDHAPERRALPLARRPQGRASGLDSESARARDRPT